MTRTRWDAASIAARRDQRAANRMAQRERHEATLADRAAIAHLQFEDAIPVVTERWLTRGVPAPTPDDVFRLLPMMTRVAWRRRHPQHPKGE